jgi:hypothetical protein
MVMFYLLPVEKALTPQQIGYGAVSVLLSWINLMQFLKLVPVLGIYIILVQKVFWTVMKVRAILELLQKYVTILENTCMQQPLAFLDEVIKSPHKVLKPL